MQRLNALHIHPTSRRISRPAQPITLLEFFMRTKGLPTALVRFVDEPYRDGGVVGEQWLQTMLPLVSVLGKLMFVLHITIKVLSLIVLPFQLVRRWRFHLWRVADWQLSTYSRPGVRPSAQHLVSVEQLLATFYRCRFVAGERRDEQGV